jgi:hypothetical protein
MTDDRPKSLDLRAPQGDDLLEGDIVLYRTPEGVVRVEVLYQAETFWLSQKKIADLFGVAVPTISYHLKEIYESGELMEKATLRRIRRVQREGRRDVAREIEFYNLDAIISVGYRVNSVQATRFRIWATQALKELVIKGFVLDDERLKLNKRCRLGETPRCLSGLQRIRGSDQCGHGFRGSSPATGRRAARRLPYQAG